MKKKLIILITIIIIIFLTIGGVFIIMNRDKYYSKLVCDKLKQYENYTETISFDFVDNKISYYNRKEKFTATDTKSIKDIYEDMLKQKDGVEENDYFKYNVEKTDDKVIINTIFDVNNFSDEFYSYIGNLSISKNNNPVEIKLILEEQNFICRIEEE